MPLARPADPKTTVLSRFSLKGKVAAVTGGARARMPIRQPATSPRRREAIIRAYKSDVKDKDTITNTINQVAKDFGKLGICVASHYNSLEYTVKQWHEIMRVNLDRATWTAQAAGKIFKQQGPGAGSLIFTASVSAILVNIPQRQSAYNASKAAVVHLAKSLAVEWIDFVRMNCISPGFIETDIIGRLPREWSDQWYTVIPGGRFCDPAELKGAYVFLASDASSYMTGANMVIDGGYTLP